MAGNKWLGEEKIFVPMGADIISFPSHIVILVFFRVRRESSILVQNADILIVMLVLFLN